jgi:hypothetical protein
MTQINHVKTSIFPDSVINEEYRGKNKGADILLFPTKDSVPIEDLKKLFATAATAEDYKAGLEELIKIHTSLKLPTEYETYTGYHEGKKEKILDFLERVWETKDKPYISTGVLTRPDFGRLDLKGKRALEDWIRYHGAHSIPEHLRMITKSEAVSRVLANEETVKIANRITSCYFSRK